MECAPRRVPVYLQPRISAPLGSNAGSPQAHRGMPLADDLDLESFIGLSERGGHIAERERDAGAMPEAPRGHPTDRLAVVPDRLVADRVGIGRRDLEAQKLERPALLLLGGGRRPSDEIRLLEVDEPSETRFERFVDLKKPDFIGRAAAAAEEEKGGALKLLCFKVAASDADAIGDEPDLARRPDGRLGDLRGLRASHRRVARARLRAASLAQADEGFEIEIIGERHGAVRLREPAFDPSGALMRG